MATKNPEIRFRLPPDLVAQIEALPDCPPPAGPGRTGGASLWVRQLVLRALGVEAPADQHAEQSKKFAQGATMRLNKNGDENLADLRRAVAQTEYSVRHVEKLTHATSGPAVFKGAEQCGAAIYGYPDNERVALERALDLAKGSE